MKSFLLGAAASFLVALIVFWVMPRNSISPDDARRLAESNTTFQGELTTLRNEYRELFAEYELLRNAQNPQEYAGGAILEVRDGTPEEMAEMERKLAGMASSALRRISSVRYEFYQMPVGQVRLPKKEIDAILTRIAAPSPDVIYLIVGIADERPYAPPFADLKQYGLALTRAKHVESLIQAAHNNQRNDIFVDVLIDQKDRRGVMISKITFAKK
ncbi:hypothetical protein [Chrysiogenes arsenatis]|uniref:hypothetical protein n=1 Tax=Chrysiogenes arsenatis TaxID=309797 RepID=UPI00042376C8|nr:hypothetical protein [Chrysiogenes arsenatis]